MRAELIAFLVEATLAVSLAMLLVLALRRPLRALWGASAAYSLWLCVPVALLAVLLPRGVTEAPLALPVAWQIAPAMVMAVTPDQQAGWHWRELLLTLWLSGALGSALVLGWRQRRFHRGLGVLRHRGDGLYQAADATAGLPAVTGVLRPRILLPADFERRYTAREQSLVIAHERLHVRRGDLIANLAAALLGCLFWFNPLLHFSLQRFRFDQELACDERVIARNPSARRPYGEAMFKTQVDPLPLPLGCHWQARHPITERIDMLKRPTPSPLHWTLALLFATTLSATTGYVAWAAQSSSLPAAARAAHEQDAAAQEHAPAAGQPVLASRMPPPRYPLDAARNGVGGKVMLLVTVRPDGRVADVQVEESTPAGVFDAVSVEAARQWTFTPEMRDGVPVQGQIRVPVTFETELQEAGADAEPARS